MGVRSWWLVSVLLVAGCGGAVPTPTFPPPTSAVSSAAAGASSSDLDKLPVRGKAPMTGYRRALFMPHGWEDPDRNGCDARRDALARQVVRDKPVVLAGTHHCVLTATILDPYTGQQIVSTKADADHVVALGDAWVTGAGDSKYPAADREALAADPDNLVAVSASVNRSKGDRDASGWLPPAKGYRCTYVARQVTVKLRYRLWVTQAEHDAIAGVLKQC